MRIAVLVKEVPDTWGDRKLHPETGLADREGSDRVLDEINERSLEVALKHREHAPDTEVVLIAMAPEKSVAALRKGLAMGADRAVHVTDTALLGADLGVTADVLAATIRRVKPDLVIAGNQSTDGSGGVIAAMLAELLDWPQATALKSVDIGESEVGGLRASDTSTMRLSASLPAVVSVTEALPEGRFPNFKGIMAAKKKPIETLTVSDLDVDPDEHGVPRSIMLKVSERPRRAAGTKIVDEGDAGVQIATYLKENRLV